MKKREIEIERDRLALQVARLGRDMSTLTDGWERQVTDRAFDLTAGLRSTLTATEAKLTESVRFFHSKASQALERLAGLALPGAKLTLLVRRPEAPSGSQDMVITDDDDIEAVITALRIRQQEALAGTDRVIPIDGTTKATGERDGE